jgi:hypothetical protein
MLRHGFFKISLGAPLATAYILQLLNRETKSILMGRRRFSRRLKVLSKKSGEELNLESGINRTFLTASFLLPFK